MSEEDPGLVTPLAVEAPGDLSYGHHILSIDPGHTTGVCLVKYTGSPDPLGFDVVWSYPIMWKDRRDIANTIRDAVLMGSLYRIVIERFVLYEHAASKLVFDDFPSCQVIGMADLAAGQVGYPEDQIVYQMASVMGSVQVLPQHASQLHKGEYAVHCYDSYRHARYYIIGALKEQLQARQKQAAALRRPK